jgi:hypothetical protein
MTGGALRTLTEREKKGDIFTNDEKQRMSEAFAIPDPLLFIRKRDHLLFAIFLS